MSRFYDIIKAIRSGRTEIIYTWAQGRLSLKKKKKKMFLLGSRMGIGDIILDEEWYKIPFCEYSTGSYSGTIGRNWITHISSCSR